MSTVSDERIQPALHALLAGEADGLRAALAADAELVAGVWNGNTLLEWANQPPHGVEPAYIEVLIDAGAPLKRVLGLAGAGVSPNSASNFSKRAPIRHRCATERQSITPLESAAMHGSTRSADVLVERVLHRPTLWLAAATGQVDLVVE